MIQEIIVKVIGIVTVYLVVKSTFFTKKKGKKKHCGSDNRDLH